MPSVPVDRSSNDPFYRYQMPTLQTTVESGKTVLTNLDQISKALHRDPGQILKYLSITLGSGLTVTGDKYVLGGTFELPRLQSAIFDYIDFFVLCQSCRNPETRFGVAPDGALQRTCSSCGAVVEQRAHRLNGQIARALDKSANEDAKYEKSKGTDISTLLASQDDLSDRVYEVYKQEGLPVSDLFAGYFKPGGLKQLRRILQEAPHEEVFVGLEKMLEESRKEEKIGSFLKGLMKQGYSAAEVEEFFSRPRKPKRSPLIKKHVEYFLDDLEGE